MLLKTELSSSASSLTVKDTYYSVSNNNNNCTALQSSDEATELSCSSCQLSTTPNGIHVCNGSNGKVQSPDVHQVSSPPTSADGEGRSRRQRVETKADWWVLICVFLFNSLSGFNFSSYSVLYLWFTELFETTRATVGWIQSIELSLTCLLGILISHPISVYGCRVVATLGSVLFAFGGILSCLSPNIAWMYVFRGIIPGVGLAMSKLAGSVIIQQRFDARRGFATGLSFVGFSVGHFVGPPIVDALLQRYAARGTLALLGAIMANSIPLSLQFRTPSSLTRRPVKTPEVTKMETNGHVTGSSSSSPSSTLCRRLTNQSSYTGCFHKVISYLRGSLDFRLLVSNKSFRLFCIIGMLHKFVLYGYMSHTANWAMAAGLPRWQAVWAVSAISFSTFVSRMLVAVLSDRHCVNIFVLFAFGLLLMIVSVFTPIIHAGVVSTFVSTVLFGISSGFCNTLAIILIVDLVGVKQVSRCIALFTFLAAFPTIAASPLTGMVYDLMRSYFAAFILFGVIGLTALCLQIYIVVIERRKKRSKLDNTPI